jgi:acyl-coenzyme A synthetase/AMP-(fatty) acid ligase
MHVIDMIYFWAKTAPDRPAIMRPDMILSYRALADAIDSVSARIAQYNLDKREPVAVSIRSEQKFLSVCLALLRSGFTVAPVGPGVFPHLRAAGINNVIAQRHAFVLSGGKNIHFEDSWITGGRKIAEGAQNPDPNGYGDLIFFTSGTTGLPKKVVEKREASLERFKVSMFGGIAHHSRVLVVPGLGSHFGFNLACDVLRAGKTLSLSLSLDESTLWMISSFGIEFIDASVYQALGLCQLKEKHPGYRFDRLKAIRIGGAAPSVDLIRRIQKNLCKDVIIIYASTEASQAAIARYELIQNIPDAVGFVVPWAELQIVDQADNPLPVGSEGYVRYRTPYFQKNRQDGGQDRGGQDRKDWFYPGDVGHLTENRVLCVRGRSDDVINRGGAKISATAVEQTLLRCPGVKDVGVCGVTGLSELLQLWIAIVPEDDFDDAVLRRFLQTDEKIKETLTTDADQIFLVDEIPRGDVGKIKRQELRDSLLAVVANQPKQ